MLENEFHSMVARFPDNLVFFWFPHRIQWGISKFAKNQKLKISKIQNGTFVRPIEKKIQ